MAKLNLPINRVKPVAAFVGQLISKLTTLDANKDGKIQFLEIMSALQVVGFEAFQSFYGFSMNEFKAQLRDIDPQERGELLAAFKEKFVLSDLEAELLLEAWIDWAVQGISLIERTKMIFGKTETVAA